MYLKLAHLVQRPSREYIPACDGHTVERTVAEAKRKDPLVGGPSVVRVAPFDLNHPMHPRHAAKRAVAQ